MVSAISNQGLLRFKVQDKPLNQEDFIAFMEDLIEDEERKIFLIVDNLRAHKSKMVMQWASEHKDRIELFFLPPYSSELNPDEYVNRALKTDIRSRAPAQIEKLKDRTHKFMRKLARSARRILKFELRSSLRNFESQNEYGYKPCIKRRFQNAETLQSRNQKNSS